MMMMNVHSVVVDAMPPPGRAGLGLGLCIRLRLISNLHLKPQLRQDITITAACWGAHVFCENKIANCANSLKEEDFTFVMI